MLGAAGVHVNSLYPVAVAAAKSSAVSTHHRARVLAQEKESRTAATDLAGDW
jgi:hypothetical protein